ncbi:MAG TPA: hypothetical protein VMK84_11335 [Streptosporangiaceae bacterium]|nr:hypothetical protein [Streptosporangiaceae bacterium]
MLPQADPHDKVSGTIHLAAMMTVVRVGLAAFTSSAGVRLTVAAVFGRAA